MIGIVLSEKDFELEIQTLVRAFFPEEESRLWTLPEEKMWNRLFDGDSAKTDPEELKSRRGEQNEADEVIAWENGQRESGKVAAWENGQRESGEVAAWENGQRESGKVAAWENGEHGSGEMAVELFQQSLPEEFPSCELYLGIRLQSGRILMLAAMGQQVFYRCFLPEQTDEDYHKRRNKESHPYRTYYKNCLKRELYELLAGLPERALPETLDKVIPVWGTMTGIRPARTPMKELLAGVDEEDVRRELTEVYRFRSDRASLCMEIARKEASLLKQLDYQNGYSLYLGIPFCPSRCLYCSFPAYPIAQYQELVPAYLEALQKEIKACGRMMKARRLTSVYLGGGTPTALSADQLKRLMDDLYQSFPMEEAAEITVEAGRPDSITIEKIQALRSMGTTRISVNPQTMKDATLIRIGRRHTVKMVQESLELARQCGFDQINMDLIMGLPGETAADFQATLGQLRSLEPENVTIHSLVIKRASALRETLERTSELGTGRRDMLEQMLQIGLKEMAEQGLLPYYIYRQKNASGFTGSTGQENIGFAKKGTECLYNILMMEEMQSILALGAGASTKWYDCQRGTVRRIENVKSVTDYVGRIDEMIMRKAETIQREPGL